ncbi:DUF1727 domain-containing protein [Candidatus Dojkabacteria bacterium]|nr:DUF1727 domain-containing protein [Candidatus Dojkabacteria bacterium]
MYLTLIPIIIFSKILTWFLKVTGEGSGTALPGRIIEKYFPRTLQKLVSQIPNIIIITGTNGKTTTQTLLNSIFKEADINIIINSAGANLSRGILSEILKQCSLTGKIDCTHAVFEIEEGTLPKIAKVLNPKIIAVTNLYRDQLDAYGEVDITQKYIRKGIEQCPNAKIILNYDDPRTSQLTKKLPNDTYYVSLPDQFSKELPYEGERTKQKSKVPNYIKAKNLKVTPNLTSEFEVLGKINNKQIKFDTQTLNAYGYFHVYNVLIAITVSKLLDIKNNIIKKGINKFNPAFGRGELITKKDKEKTVNFRMLLVKNPAGYSLNLDLIRSVKNLKLILLLNDNTADGKDISWIWDARFELLNKSDITWMILGGTRAKDLQVRLKYALNEYSEYFLDEDINKCIEKSFNNANNNDTIFVLPTYTAMLKFRKLLGKKLE